MAWCQNPNCGKSNLRKEDVEFDEERRLVLCHGCMALHHPGWLPPVEVVDRTVPDGARPKLLDYEISLTSKDGFKARVSYGDVSLAFHAPPELLEKWIS